MPELRKRKAHQLPQSEPPAKKSTGAAAKKASTKVKEAVKAVLKPSKKEEKPLEDKKPAALAAPKGKAAAKDSKAPSPKTASKGKVSVGDKITIEGFGGEIQTNDGETTTLKELLDRSGSGVVLFTYPKASTPGCTTQVCLFRDSYEPLTAGGLAIYGLSADSPKANTTFKEKQKLPYTLLCDPSSTLIAAIGLQKTPKGTQRGVFVVDKQGEVLLAESGGPGATVEAVKKLVEEQKN